MKIWKQAPIRNWQAKFEIFTLAALNRPALYATSASLERFLGAFPKLSKPEDFNRLHLEDYKRLHLRLGTKPETVNWDIRTVRSFWRWMIQEGVLVVDITDNIRGLKTAKKKGRISLDEIIRLFETIDDVRVKSYMLRLLEGENARDAAVASGLSYASAYRRFKLATDQLGLQVRPYTLRSASANAALMCLSDFLYREKRNSCGVETEIESDRLSDIQVPTNDVGSTVVYAN